MTDKLSLTDVASLQNETTALAQLAANNAATITALDNTLSRDGTSPNQMSASLDMNSNRIINLPQAVSDTEPVRLLEIGNAPVYAANALASAAASASSATTASTQASNAAYSASSASSSASSAASSAATATTEAGIATTQAGVATTQASAAAASAIAAAATETTLVAGLSTSSSTSVAIGTGSQTFTTASGKLYTAGQFLLVSSAANSANYMHGTVTSYSGTSLVMNITDFGGSGTHSDWNINLSGTQGPAGSGTISGMTSDGVMYATGTSAGTSTAALTNGQIIVGVTSNPPAAVTVSGDATLASNGALTLANGSTTRSNLGLAIGTNVQAYDAQLSSKISQNSQSAAYTTVLTDGEKHIFHPAADTTARTWTIDSNANVAYPVGTAITFAGESSSGVITLAITSDTLVWLPSASTGTRTLTAPFLATALKVTSTKWFLTGTGIS
jgi:hypothetical protein